MKGEDADLEVPRIGQSVCPDGPQIGQAELARIHLQHVPPRGALRKVHLESDPSGDHHDGARRHLQEPQFRGDVQRAVLRHNKVVSVGVGEALVEHVLVRAVHVDRVAVLKAYDTTCRT
eukprot:2484465-Pyramimonas_sp.AAC.1